MLNKKGFELEVSLIFC